MTADADYCQELVREVDKDRFLASLFAPAAHRPALFALYAFNAEIARVRDVAREPMPGEIRLQWWREVLEGKRDEEAAANPVAAALLDVVRNFDVPAAQLIDVIDAHAADLYTEREVDFEAYGAATDGAIMALAARILGGDNADAQHIATHLGIGRVYAAAGLAEDARRQLDLARDLLPRVPVGMFPALLPAATLRSSLGRDTPLPLWRRQWLIWRGARNPQRMFG